VELGSNVQSFWHHKIPLVQFGVQPWKIGTSPSVILKAQILGFCFSCGFRFPLGFGFWASFLYVHRWGVDSSEKYDIFWSKIWWKFANQKKRKAWRVTTFYGFSFEQDTLVKCIQNLIMIIFIHVKWKWEMQEVSRVLYGCNRGEVLKPLPLHNTLSSASVEQNFDVQVSTCWFPWSS